MGPIIYSKQNGGMRMNKRFAILVAFCMVSMAITTILPTAVSQTYGGSVLTGDNSDPPNYKNYFDLWEDVYYYIYATEDGFPLQQKDIDISILDPSGTEVHTNSIITDQDGNAQGVWVGTGIPSNLNYTIYANYTGNNLATTIFKIYDPIPSNADVSTYANNNRYNGGNPAYYFSSTVTSTDWIYFSIFIQDQFGNLFHEEYNPDEIHYWIYHNEQEDNPESSFTNEEGYIDDSYRPFPTFQNEARFGIYRINVTREDGTPIGNTTFEVVDVDIEVTPFKAQYVQGDDITITVDASITGTIDIRIVDPDGVVVPTANWTDQNLVNGQWTVTYTLLSTLPDGNYEIQVIKSGNLMETKGFSIQKFALAVLTDSGAYLPGETITVYYTITNNRDGSDVTDASLEWIFQYYDLDGASYKIIRDGPSPTGPFGSFQVSIPTSVYSFIDPDLWVWANDTGGHSDTKHLPINIGSISASLYLGDDGDNDYVYLAGDFIVVNVEAFVFDTYPLRSGDVKLNVTKEGVQLSAYTKTGLMTDEQGRLMYIFSLQGNTETGIYTIGINVSKEDTREWDTASTNFEVVDHRDLSVDLGFDKPQYYSGDTVTVTYTALRGEVIEENVNCEYRIYYLDSDLHAHYIAAGTTSTGQFTFTIPSDLVGELYVNVEVTDSDGIGAQRTETLDISRADILLTPDKNQYRPGDIISVGYALVGNPVPNAAYYYEIEDDHDNVVKRGSISVLGEPFTFTVPDANVPDSYTISGYVTDGSGETVAENSVTIIKLSGFMIAFTLDKPTYRPGEKATLNYEIMSLDDSEVPDMFTLYYGFYGGQQRSLQTSKASGKLTVVVPDDAADGVGGFYIFSSEELGFAGAQQQANIRAEPNPLAEPVFGDITLLGLILVVLVIISLIFGFMGWRLGKKALSESKLPPWKKERPLPEPENFREPSEPEPPAPPMDEEFPPPPSD